MWWVGMQAVSAGCVLHCAVGRWELKEGEGSGRCGRAPIQPQNHGVVLRILVLHKHVEQRPAGGIIHGDVPAEAACVGGSVSKTPCSREWMRAKYAIKECL